jgi:hypothetical protein
MGPVQVRGVLAAREFAREFARKFTREFARTSLRRACNLPVGLGEGFWGDCAQPVREQA